MAETFKLGSCGSEELNVRLARFRRDFKNFSVPDSFSTTGGFDQRRQKTFHICKSENAQRKNKIYDQILNHQQSNNRKFKCKKKHEA